MSPIDTERLARTLTRAAEQFRVPDETPSRQKAAEWYLDNQYLVARAARQSATEVPSGFWRRLPYAGDGAPIPRVLHLARVLLESTRVELDEATLASFVETFQRRAPLTIAELWAWPAMLRISTLETLVSAVATFFPADGGPTVAAAELRLDPAVAVERCIRVLRFLADVDWKVFFQRHSAVDAALRDDPARIYTRMTFESRDAYRKVVEEVAWETGLPEPDVACAAVDLAENDPSDPREGHVGYYLVDRGAARWKAELGYRARGPASLRDVALAWPTFVYLGPILLIAGLGCAGVLASLSPIVGLGAALATALLASVPLVSIAVALVNLVTTRVVPPRVLPQLDLSAGVPDDCRTLVVVPALVSRPEDVDALFEQLELHHIASAGPSVGFALLTDFVDSASPPDVTAILARADERVAELAKKHAGSGPCPFHLLHREARFNERDRVYMGWERKRGKLEELNRLLRGDRTTSYVHHAGDPAGLERIRFVVTLDADTRLPLGAVQKLVGLAAHPLNVARFDGESGRVVDGYSIVQPRIETHPDEPAPSRFGRITAGETSLDIYTHAVSDLYQDLFGAGAFVGKGLYDIDAFVRSIHSRVPENTLASHDLFEGIHGRVALATDVVLLEHQPQHVIGAARRGHRWIRGDWQLLPWLLPWVPTTNGWRRNRLVAIDRWKILDNLRRSLLAPAILALVILFAATLPAYAAGLVLVPLATWLVLFLPDLFSPRVGDALRRTGVAIALLPYDAATALDGAIRAVFRMAVSRRRLLEWVTAAQTASTLARSARGTFWSALGPASILAVVAVLALSLVRGAWPIAAVAAPVLLAWLAAPELARWLSAPRAPARALDEAERRRLRRLARRTWAFFETFVTPEDHWLAPDNFQEDPGPVVAHRTSPTNVGLMLVADLVAFDFGYLGRSELRALLAHSLESIERLERHRGHLLNWYDTRTLAPLLPRYVSTVDSGNLAASLLVVAQGCREAAGSSKVRPARWVGLLDTLELLEEALERLGLADASIAAPVRTAIDASRKDDADHAGLASQLTNEVVPALEARLLAALGAHTSGEELAALREVRTWYDRLKRQSRSLAADLAELPPDVPEGLRALADRAEVLARGMEFGFLFDEKKRLFHIGYNATADRLDTNHYDLLASEARIASFLAIVARQIPPTHWTALGRPITRIHGRAALLSWGGTMFEFLMPSLFLKSQDGSLLATSVELAVAAQIDYGEERGVPWGVSESGFSVRDARENYQYQSFGVPGTGMRRGLESELVIAPYASLLAVGVAPHEVLSNLDRLEALGAMGRYGLYEAIDYRDAERPAAIVKSHMAHHQGMIFAALDNALHDDVLVDRLHADPLVRTGDALLSERVPSLRAVELRAPEVKEAPVERPSLAPRPAFASWTPDTESPQVMLLGNGRLTSTITDTGAGSLRWKGLAVIGAEDDPTCDSDGTWIYVRDDDSGEVWSATPAPTRARLPSDEIVFHAHEVQTHHRTSGISLRTEMGVAAQEDVEVRIVTLHNESDAPRTLRLVSFAEPILELRASARRHPAFSRMFVGCERLDHQRAVLAWRRERDANAPKVVALQRLVFDEGTGVTWAGAELDRGTFVGRRCGPRNPTLAMRVGSDTSSATVDPAIALAVRIALPPRGQVEVALVTAVAEDRAGVLALSRRFGSLHVARWAMHDAKRQTARELHRAGLTPELLPILMQAASRLVLPASPLRPPGELIDRSPARRRLWGHGISGDDPIVAVRVHDPSEGALVREVLTLHRFLASRHVPFELVFLDAAPSSYQPVGSGHLREVIEAAGMSGRIGERAGIRLLAIDTLAPGELDDVIGASRVYLDARRGSLGQHLAAHSSTSPPLPDFAGSTPPDPATLDVPLPADLVLRGDYGGFTPDGREYVIRTEPGQPTPAPWCNVLANENVGCLVSESGLGATWSGNSGENRLTPWRNDPVSDVPAEALYLRDEETAEIWSPTPLPAGLDAPSRVRHGAGTTTYERESHHLSQSMTVLVPVDAPVKIVRLTLRNRSDRARRLTASYYAEWVLGALRENQRAHMHLGYDADAGLLFSSTGWNHEHGERVAFLAADRMPHGHTCDRTEWIGRSGTLARPRALGRWGLSGSTDSTADPCAVLQTHLEIPAGETLVTHFVLGQGVDHAEVVALAKRFRAPGAVDEAIAAVERRWDEVLGAVVVETPSVAMNVLLNRWLLYQTLACRFLARSGFYQSSGAYGFRDQLQDVMGLVHVEPKLVREHLLRAAEHQFEEGDVLHWWHPPQDRGVRTRCSDDMAWLPYVVCHYVAATGDLSVLDEEVPYLHATPLGALEHDRFSDYPFGERKGSLLEHCRRALDRASTEGPHGLPLIGTCDWNDGMNRVGELGQGESVWLGWFLAATMRDFAVLCDRIGEGREATEWRTKSTKLLARTDEVGWDGAWYKRAFYDDGTPLGTASARQCRIDSIAQSWSVIAGAPSLERSRRAMRSAETHLVREKERLVLLLEPPFEPGLRHPGYIESYPPGVRENGGQYTHAAVWLGIAHAKLGDGAAAERIFRLLNPILRSTDAQLGERYRIEPYVLAGDVYGVAPLSGRGGWSWYTGAASWMWRLGVEHILGLQIVDGGELRVDPCIPPEWPRFEAKVRVGGRTIRVVVENPHGVAQGVAAQVREGDQLRVTLGRAAHAA